MEITFNAQFCSHGEFVKSNQNGVDWISKTNWENQHGIGVDFELNLIWFRISLDVYRQKSVLLAETKEFWDEVKARTSDGA